MPASRRTVFPLLVGLTAAALPACLGVTKPVARTDPPANPAARQLAALRPGERVAIHPDARATATVEVPTPAPAPSTPPATTAGKTDPAGEPRAPRRLPPPDSEAPSAAADKLIPVKAEPAPFPVAPAAPPPEPPLLAAMRAYVENRPDDAIRHLQSLDKPNQDFALTVMPLLVRGAQLNMAAADPADVAVMADQFQAVASGMEGKAALRVEKVVFCKRATGFGRYDPWPEAQPYRPNDLAVLYVELKHVGSAAAAGPNGEGFESHAVVNLEVRDAGGRLIEQTDPADWRRRVPVARFEHADRTRSPLRDYSRTYRISVPSQPGVYTVTVEARDPAGNRAARSQPAEFRVAGP